MGQIKASSLGKIHTIKELPPHSTTGCAAKECKQMADFEVTFDTKFWLAKVKVCALHKNAIVQKEKEAKE